MQTWIILSLYILSTVIKICTGIASPIKPFTIYDHAIQLEANVVELWWKVNNTAQEITFELHVKTVGWIALGISPGRKSNSSLLFLFLYF